jgi:hypothetical protein
MDNTTVENKVRHTPGPWIAAHDFDNDSIVIDADTNSICTIDSYKECAEANAKLIEAAPDLLEALQWALNNLDSYNTPSDENLRMYKKAVAAIKKATE